MKLSAALSSLALLCGMQASHAITFDLSNSLDSGLNTGVVGTISFTQVGSDTHVDLDADWNAALLGANTFLTRLYLTYDGAAPLSLSSFSGDSVVTDAGPLPGAGVNAGFHWDYKIELPTSNKGNRLLDGESLSLVFANTDADDFGALSMVHLQGMTAGGSVKVTTPIPEPETYALMGMGLLGMAALRRRRA